MLADTELAFFSKHTYNIVDVPIAIGFRRWLSFNTLSINLRLYNEFLFHIPFPSTETISARNGSMSAEFSAISNVTCVKKSVVLCSAAVDHTAQISPEQDLPTN
jgi:hypothetical protein